MTLDKLRNLLSDKESNPNKFTQEMGNLIRKARQEANLSQDALAKLIYRRRATISDLENGKSLVDTVTVALLAGALNRPITYFFPRFTRRQITSDDLTPEQQELLIQFNRIWDEKMQEIAINQVRSLAELSTRDDLDDIGREN